MANLSTLWQIVSKGIKCIPGISEDTLRQLADSFEIVATDATKDLEVVTSTAGVPLNFNVDTTGLVTLEAKLNGHPINVLGGDISIFSGRPTASNPGRGWEILVEDTIQSLNQPANQVEWRLFLAKKIGTLNTFTP